MTRRASALVAGVVAFAIMLGMGAIWSFASPLGSVPDETAHVAKATATARGEWTGTPSTGEGAVAGQRLMQVPGYVHELATEYSCHYFNADVTAACDGAAFDRGSELEAFSTTAGLYNPVYYLAVGWPSLLLEQAPALYAMRLASALLGAILMGIAAWALVVAGAGRLGLVALALGTTPMVAYLTGAVNPNGYEATSAIAFLASGAAALRRPSWATLLATAATGALLLNGRSITPLWALVLAIVVLMLAAWPQLRALMRQPATWVAVVILGVASAFSLWWTVSTGVLSNGVAYAGAGTPPLAGLLEMLARTFQYYPGAVAVMGWLDVPAPIGTLVLCGAGLVALVVAAVILGDPRERLAVLTIAAATALLPALVTALSVQQLGYIWQGRYILALLVPTAVLAGIVLDRVLARRADPLRLPGALGIVTGLLVAFAHLLPMIAVLKRYSVGFSATIGDFLLRPQWQPPGGVLLVLTAWGVVLVGLAVAVALASRALPATGDGDEGALPTDADGPVRQQADEIAPDARGSDAAGSGAVEERADARRVAVDDG